MTDGSRIPGDGQKLPQFPYVGQPLPGLFGQATGESDGLQRTALIGPPVDTAVIVSVLHPLVLGVDKEKALLGLAVFHEIPNGRGHFLFQRPVAFLEGEVGAAVLGRGRLGIIAINLALDLEAIGGEDVGGDGVVQKILAGRGEGRQ